MLNAAEWRHDWFSCVQAYVADWNMGGGVCARSRRTEYESGEFRITALFAWVEDGCGS